MFKFSTGFRDMNNGYQAQVKGAVVGAGLTFVDGGAGADTITDSGEGFITAGFAPGDKLFVQGATTSGNDTDLTGERIVSVTAGTLTLATGTVNTGEAGAAGTVVAVAKGGSMFDIFKDGVVRIYSGTRRSSPDDSIGSSTLLMQFTQDAGTFVAGAFDNGLQFEFDPTDGVMEKSASQTWQAVCLVSGVASWGTFVGNAADTGAASTTLPRMDFDVGISGYDGEFGTTTLVAGRTYNLDTFTMTMYEYYGASS